MERGASFVSRLSEFRKALAQGSALKLKVISAVLCVSSRSLGKPAISTQRTQRYAEAAEKILIEGTTAQPDAPQPSVGPPRHKIAMMY
jgi:hypothetical protein